MLLEWCQEARACWAIYPAGTERVTGQTGWLTTEIWKAHVTDLRSLKVIPLGVLDQENSSHDEVINCVV